MRLPSPGLTFAAGLLFAGVGLVVVGIGVADLGWANDPATLPACPNAGDCVEYEAAMVWEESDNRTTGLLDGQDSWHLGLAKDTKRAVGAFEVTVPSQPGQDLVRPDMVVTVVFHEDDPVRLKLPDGTWLDTAANPRRSAPTLIYMGLGALGLGWFCLRAGWAQGRRRPDESSGEASAGRRPRRSEADQPAGVVVGASLFFGALGGLMTQYRTGPALWPAFLVASGLAAATALALWLARRRVAGKPT